MTFPMRSALLLGAAAALLAACSSGTDEPANQIYNETTVEAGNTMNAMEVAPGARNTLDQVVNSGALPGGNAANTDGASGNAGTAAD